MPTSQVNAYVTPESTGQPVVHEDLAKLVKQMMLGDVMRFASHLERAAAFTTLGVAPPVGSLSHRADTGVCERYTGVGTGPSDATAWRMVGPHRQKQTLTASAASVSFTIPTGMRRIKLDWTARSDAGGFQAQSARLRINGDAGTNYHWQYVQGSAAAASAGNATNSSFGHVGLQLTSTAPAGAFASGVVDIVGWDAPHSNFLGFTFNSQTISIGVATWTLSGGGAYIGNGPYLTLSLQPEAGNWVAGSQFAIEAWD